MLDWSIDWRHIYNDFIVNLFLIWCLNIFDFCLHNCKFCIGSRKFVWGWGSKKGASQNFHIKRESLVKLSGCCKKGGCHKLTLTLSKVIFLSLFGVCVLYHFYQYFLCFNRKDLVLVLTESNQYMYDPFKWATLNSKDIVDLFTNSKDIVNLYEVNLCIRQSFIHYIQVTVVGA